MMMKKRFYTLGVFAVTLSVLVSAAGCSWFENDAVEPKDEFYRPVGQASAPRGPNAGTADLDPNSANLPTVYQEGAGLGPYDGFGSVIKDVVFQPVYFRFDHSGILTTEYSKLDAVVAFLQSRKDAGVVIEGNCDARGSEEYNRALGERRAISAQEYLLASGIDASRMKTISYGKERPAVPGDTEEAYRKNRRDDFVPVKLLK